MERSIAWSFMAAVAVGVMSNNRAQAVHCSPAFSDSHSHSEIPSRISSGTCAGCSRCNGGL